MASSKKKRGPTYTIEMPADGLGKFTQMLDRAPRLMRQLGQATEPIKVECTVDELETLAVAFRIAAIALPESASQRIQAVQQQINDILENHKRERETARAQPLMRTDDLFQFKISLAHIQPEIWRRVQVPDCTLYDLHNIIQVAMGWDDDHLHQFTVERVRYVMPDSDDLEFDDKVEDETRTLLSQIITPKRRKVKIDYEYDFGDSWHHEVLFESRLAREPKVRYPRCIDGARKCPAEDCGGPWGYEGFLNSLAHPDAESSADDIEWIGEDWNPEDFSVEAVNKSLPKLEFIEDEDV